MNTEEHNIDLAKRCLVIIGRYESGKSGLFRLASGLQFVSDNLEVSDLSWMDKFREFAFGVEGINAIRLDAESHPRFPQEPVTPYSDIDRIEDDRSISLYLTEIKTLIEKKWPNLYINDNEI